QASLSHGSPKPLHNVAMSTGAMTEVPVVLLKTSRPWFTIWTYCVRPTSPFVSGGAQLQPTPGNGMPSKLRIGDGIRGPATVFCWTVSGAFTWERPVFGFGLASC